MSATEDLRDSAPGDEPEAQGDVCKRVRGYVIGLALAVLLTAASFWVVTSNVIYGPGIRVAVLTLAVAQIGIHLVFFLHITTSPDNTNNVLALAFGSLIVILIVFGSIWIMAHLNQNMLPMNELMQMQ
jgi:cytochrome o ubiquinol oxidase operon protein cyoD